MSKSSPDDGNTAPKANMMATHVGGQQTRGPRNRGVLTVTSGPDTGRVLSIPIGLATLGRSEECSFQFSDLSLSRVHARVLVINGQFAFCDAGSTNGSMVNEMLSKANDPMPLKDGDRIQLGTETTLRFSIVDEAEEIALKKVYEAAIRDGLTGVYNRKHLEERLDSELSFATRHNTELSVIILDVDYFKRINDQFGHLAGDAVLRTIAQSLMQTVRTEDLVARYGGEEFVIVVRGNEVSRTFVMAERIRIKIEQTVIAHEHNNITATISAGVASLHCCGQQRTKTMLLTTADSRLYKAKQSGRNRVIGPLPNGLTTKR